MARHDDTPAKYQQVKVEALMLEVAAELHPSHLTEEELIAKVAGDPNDAREIETAKLAISGLREFGLARPRDDEVVELTPAALRAVALLAG